MLDAIVSTGSLTRAADRIGLSQSALSHRLAGLEQRLDSRLFDRVGKKMIPTKMGESLASAAHEILNQCAIAERVIEVASGTSTRSVIRLATSCFSCDYTWLSRAFARFGVAHPDVDVNLVMEPIRGEAAVLDKSAADMVVTAHPPRRSDLVCLKVFSHEVDALARKDHWISRRHASGRPIAWKDLGSETLLIHDLPTTDEIALRDAVWGKAKSKAARAQGSIRRIQLTEAIVGLVESGIGIGIMTRRPSPTPFGSKSLSWVPITPRTHRHYWAVWRRDAKSPRLLDELARMMTVDQPRPRERNLAARKSERP